MSIHHHHQEPDATGSIRAAFLLNLMFTLIEIVGGILTNSLAILADALHDLGDSFALGLAWYMEGRANQPRRGAYSYGYRRLSLLAALINAVVLVVGSLLILTLAVPRLLEPQATSAGGMLALAILGILVNGAAVLRLRGGKTLNAKVIAWHLIEDVLGWLAVLIVSLVLLITDLHILDPLLSILITLYVLYNVVRNLRSTIALFLQAAPANLDVAEIDEQMAAIPGVMSSHHTHFWSLDGEHHVFTTHLVVPATTGRLEVIAIKRAVLALLAQQGLQPEHATIEVEYADEICVMTPGGP